MFAMQHAKHFGALDNQNRGGGYGCGRNQADQLAGEAGFTKKIAGTKNRHNGLLSILIHDGKFYPAGSDIQNILRGIALRENPMLLRKFFYFSAQAAGV